jgi:hypothetical protein
VRNHQAGDFEAACAALPPRVGPSGWAARWAAAAAPALAEGRRWAVFAANEEKAKAEAAAPVWGVVKEYGRGSFSSLYVYAVRSGAGSMTRPQAQAEAEAAKASDPRHEAGVKFWEAMMAW